MERATKIVVIVVSIVAGLLVLLVGGIAVIGLAIYVQAHRSPPLSTTPVAIVMHNSAALNDVPRDFPDLQCHIRLPRDWRIEPKTLSSGQPGYMVSTAGAAVGIWKLDRHAMDFPRYVRANLRGITNHFPDAVIDAQGPTNINGLAGYVVLYHRTGKMGELLHHEAILLETTDTTVYMIESTANLSGSFGGANAQDAMESAASTFERGTAPPPVGAP